MWLVPLGRHDQRVSVELVILLRLSNNIGELQLQRPMSEVCWRCSEVGGWQNEDGVELEYVRGQRLTEWVWSSVSMTSDATGEEDVASALMLHLCCSDQMSSDFWGQNK